MSPAVITLQFDPTVDVLGRPMRWETLALAAVIVVALAVAAWLAERMNRRPTVAGPDVARADGAPGAENGAEAQKPDAEQGPGTEKTSGRKRASGRMKATGGEKAVDAKSDAGPLTPTPTRAMEGELRRDDLLFLVIGAIPGAVIGGRILHTLDFFDYYFRVDNPSALLDPGRGTLSLLGAVLGGTLTAAYVGWLLGAPLRRWMDLAIVPLLLAIGLGKFASLLGGTGQGAITDVPWAVAFAGGGPWRSLGADLPAHPSQVYEGVWALAGILVVGVMTVPGVWRALPGELQSRPVPYREARAARSRDVPPQGLPPASGPVPAFLFAVGLGWWAAGRFVVGFSWRDQPVLGSLVMEQLSALLVLLVLAILLVVRFLPRRGRQY